ncbi:MAG: hypothetical protein ACRD9L_16220, partial [Bryobacteraceae bacterium]
MRSAVLFAGLGTLLVGCRQAQPPTARIDPGLASFVPPDTLVLMETRLDSLRSTAVYRKYLGAQILPQLDEFARGTGIDPRK